MAQKNVSLKKNFVMNAILAMSSFIFPLITFPYTSRILLETGLGKVNFASSLITYFNMFAYLGIPTYGIRACASVRDDKEKLSRTAHELMIINLVMAVFAYTALFIALFTVPRLFSERILYVIVSGNIILYALSLEWMYKALEQYSYITIRSLVFKAISVVCMLMLIKTESDYVIYGAISVFASSASYLLNLVNARRYIYMHPMKGYDFKRHLRPVMVFFAMSVATTVYTHLDTVMLGFMTSDADVGYYSAAVKIKTILVTIVTSLGTVILPRASYYIKKGEVEKFWNIAGKALNFVCLLAVPMTVYFILFAKEGIVFLASNRYFPSIEPMQLIMPTVVLIGLSNIMGIQILVPTGREKIVLYSEIAGAITDLVLNAMLIPTMKASGAAIGTLAAELVVTGWQFMAIRKEVIPEYKKIKIGAIAAATAAGMLVSVWCKMLTISSFFILFVSACMFFGAYLAVMTVMKEPLILDIESQIFGKLKSIMQR